jgi:hypothetical protein
MKNAFEMDSGAMVQITKFRKDWFRYSEVNGEGSSQTHRQRDDRISLLEYFLKQEGDPKIKKKDGTYLRPDNICVDTGTLVVRTGLGLGLGLGLPMPRRVIRTS